MYLLFREHHIMPSQSWGMKPGEYAVARAFLVKELEERKAEIDALKGH